MSILCSRAALSKGSMIASLIQGVSARLVINKTAFSSPRSSGDQLVQRAGEVFVVGHDLVLPGRLPLLLIEHCTTVAEAPRGAPGVVLFHCLLVFRPQYFRH